MKFGTSFILLTSLVVSLFSCASSQSLPGANSAKTQDSYIIGASDVIEIQVWNAKKFEGGPLKEYRTKGSMLVDYNLRRIIKQGTICPIEEHVASETTKIRHDPDKLAQTILNIICKNDGRTEAKGLKRPAHKPQTSTHKPLPCRVATLGRIPLNMDLSEPCVNCL